MKKFLLAVFFAVLAVSAGFYIAESLKPETKIITVPVMVYSGDTLHGICSRVALQYGDVRSDLREISWYAAKKNNIGQYIYPGQVLYIDLVVPVEEHEN